MKNQVATAKKLSLTVLAVGTFMMQGASAATTNVSFSNFSFSPAVITVNVGDTIIWSNAGGFHTVTGTGAEAMCGSGSVASSCSHTFLTAGSFPYHCNFHFSCCNMTGLVNVVSAAIPPGVNLTSPTNGAIFAAPANVKMAASTTAGNGTVTNVQFFANASSVGSATASPFNITANALTAGSYALTAVAKDTRGLSGTSGVVNITVVSPVAISNFFAQASGSQFSFDYTATPGLNYVVENSSNLVNWAPLSTNTAASNTVQVIEALIPGSGPRFYRVGQLPNP